MRGPAQLHQMALGPGFAERTLARRDRVLARIIAGQVVRWPTQQDEDLVWGLLKIVLGQQVSTARAAHLAKQIASMYGPMPANIQQSLQLSVHELRALGLSTGRAMCTVEIASRAEEIRAAVRRGESGWLPVLKSIKGIGPWTIDLFRIGVLREPDVLPERDVGLERAFRNTYGSDAQLATHANLWRPYRSVACWYLWRSLGNFPLV
jgi:DNA-3-methyladenine glycosylase II